MDASAALSIGGAVGTALLGATSAVYAKRADRQTKNTGNGFAGHVLTALDTIMVSQSDILKRLERLEQK